jgi:hypothetical protein
MIVILNPQGSYPKGSPMALVEACGLIPLFFEDAVKGEQDPSEVWAEMVRLYSFGDWSGDWGEISEDGETLASNEGDPTLYALLTMLDLDSGIKLAVFPNAILALTKKGYAPIVGRMD